MKLRLELTDGEHTTGRQIDLVRDEYTNQLEIHLCLQDMRRSLEQSKQSTKSVSLTQVGTVHGELPGE